MLTIGVSLPSSGSRASAGSILAVAEAAERLGYDSVWVSDHIVAPERPRSAYPYGGGGPFRAAGSETYYEPLTTLAWIAGAVPRVRLGVSVLVVPLRNPVYAAKTIATLDALSGGRVTLGIGVGWLQDEFEALGETRFDARGAVTDEWIEIYRAHWSDAPVTEHTGAHYRHGPVRAYPKPIQRTEDSESVWPGPPIWVGGNSAPALRRTARLGNGWQGLRTSVEETRRCLEQLDSLLLEAGRTRSDLTISSRLNVSGTAAPAEFDWDISGDPDHAASRIQRYLALGATDLLLSPQPRDSVAGMIESLEWFAAEVRTRLA